MVPNWKQPTAMWLARIICESGWVRRRWAEQQWLNQALASAAN
jgi:hypothetical protein